MTSVGAHLAQCASEHVKPKKKHQLPDTNILVAMEWTWKELQNPPAQGWCLSLVHSEWSAQAAVSFAHTPQGCTVVCKYGSAGGEPVVAASFVVVKPAVATADRYAVLGVFECNTPGVGVGHNVPDTDASGIYIAAAYGGPAVFAVSWALRTALHRWSATAWRH